MHKIISLLLLLISLQANAQDTLRVDKISLGGNFNTGNSESFQITSKANVSYQGANSKYGLIFSPDYFLLYTGNSGEFLKKSEDFRADIFGWKDLKNSYNNHLLLNKEYIKDYYGEQIAEACEKADIIYTLDNYQQLLGQHQIEPSAPPSSSIHSAIDKYIKNSN